MTDEVNRGFQGFIKNLCRGVLVDIWLPSDVHATDIMNGDKEVSAIPRNTHQSDNPHTRTHSNTAVTGT